MGSFPFRHGFTGGFVPGAGSAGGETGKPEVDGAEKGGSDRRAGGTGLAF
jgi:hypothetical protein